MKRLLTMNRRYFVTVLLVTSGLGAYGCGDSGSVDPGPQLASLSVTGETLQPPFASETTGYGVDLSSNTSEVTVSATKSDPNEVLSGAVSVPVGQASGQAPVQAPAPGSTSTITLTVSASDGRAKVYTIALNRAALGENNALRSLTVSQGSLTPAFTPNTTGYTVNVESDVTSLSVTATKSDSNAVMSGSVTAGAGQPTGQADISLNGEGTATAVLITVAAPNGIQKTYTVTVNRAAPPPPAPPTPPPAPESAPDLIEADDSCLLISGTNDCDPGSGTTRDDNFTNVARPRFQIPTPRQEETPNLYVDGNQVESTFDSGADTLQPTAPLSDGAHAITSTVTHNATGLESPQSQPPLSVTINTGAPGAPEGKSGKR